MKENFTFTASSHRTLGDDDKNLHSVSPPIGGARTLLLNSVFNASAAANRLPVELVVKILISGAWIEWYELLPLTHICQHWRNVARGTPRLWTDAVVSAFKSGQDHIRCLPTLLEWSAPYPLRLAIRSVPHVGQSAILEPHFDILGPHFSRMSYLSVDIACTANVVAVLDAARSGMRNLESLRIKQILGSQVSVDDRVGLDDSDFPRLHTLSFPGFFFTRAVAVKSLRSITVDTVPRSRPIFLTALERCALGLESLTLNMWAHIDWVVDEEVSTVASVELPSLRYLKIKMASYTNHPALFLPGLLLPPDVRMDLKWDDVHDRNTRDILPRHLVGLHAPPFFDEMCVHLSGVNSVVVNCFTGGAERLCIQEYSCSRERLPAILDEYTSAHVTQLTVYLGFDNPCKSFINGDHLYEFINGFPNLHRLDLLGKGIRDVKLQMVEAFLGLPGYSDSTEPYYLGFALEVEEPPPDPDLRNPDERYYSDEYQATLVHDQLDQLEELLYRYASAGAPALHRLELCVTIDRLDPEKLLSAQYYRIADTPVSSYWARELSSLYLPRFQALVDEAMFL
ncbi:hypothetical protein V8D89_004363 [Ganoderma adspersum]